MNSSLQESSSVTSAGRLVDSVTSFGTASLSILDHWKYCINHTYIDRQKHPKITLCYWLVYSKPQIKSSVRSWIETKALFPISADKVSDVDVICNIILKVNLFSKLTPKSTTLHCFTDILRSAAGHQLVIPSHRFTTYGRRAFSVAGPMFWNSLPRDLRDASHTAAVFGRSLKTFLFSQSTSVHSASEAFAMVHYINWCFTYLLTFIRF